MLRFVGLLVLACLVAGCAVRPKSVTKAVANPTTQISEAEQMRNRYLSLRGGIIMDDGDEWEVISEPMMCKGIAGEYAGFGCGVQVAIVKRGSQVMLCLVRSYERLKIGSKVKVKLVGVSDGTTYNFREFVP